MSSLNDEQLRQINEELLARRKIAAIKIYREATGCQLVDAKQEVEKIEAVLRQKEPERFARKSGCMGVLVFCALVAAGMLTVCFVIFS
jgi:CHASE3 domain sensor protein